MLSRVLQPTITLAELNHHWRCQHHHYQQHRQQQQEQQKQIGCDAVK